MACCQRWVELKASLATGISWLKAADVHCEGSNRCDVKGVGRCCCQEEEEEEEEGCVI